MFDFLVPINEKSVNEKYQILLKEIENYDKNMLLKKRLLVISKTDLADDEIKNMGSYQVKWHGYNDSGSLVPSGIYLIHFTSESFSKHFKTVLIK